jgi:hypothetical protein
VSYRATAGCFRIVSARQDGLQVARACPSPEPDRHGRSEAARRTGSRLRLATPMRRRRRIAHSRVNTLVESATTSVLRDGRHHLVLADTRRGGVRPKRPRSTASLSRLSNSDRISLLSRCGDSDESKWITRLPRRTRIPISPCVRPSSGDAQARFGPLRPWVAVNAQFGHPNARQFVGRGCLTVRGLGYRGALTRRARAPAPLCNRSCGLAGCTPRT